MYVISVWLMTGEEGAWFFAVKEGEKKAKTSSRD